MEIIAYFVSFSMKVAKRRRASLAGWQGAGETRRCIACACRQCTIAADAVALDNLLRSAKRMNRGSVELGHAHPPGTSGNLTAGVGHQCDPSLAPKQSQRQRHPGMPEWPIFFEYLLKSGKVQVTQSIVRLLEQFYTMANSLKASSLT